MIASPALPDGRDWAFWQYTNRMLLPGYTGEEHFIDGNVFGGTAMEFAAWAGEG